MTRFFWIRHAPTHAKAMVGWTDLACDLSDTAALSRLRAVLPAGAVVQSSDLARAVATADALYPGPRLPHDRNLREIHFGHWELRSFAEVEREDPVSIRAFWDDPGQSCAPGGESWNDLTARVWAATDRLASTHPGADIVIVAHFGAILAALQRALALTAAQVFAHRIENLSVTELTLLPGGWQVGRINHLP